MPHSQMRLGGAGRDRTDDLKLAKLALSQLSYGPDKAAQNENVGELRLRLPDDGGPG